MTEWKYCSNELPERDKDVLAYVKGIGIHYYSVMWTELPLPPYDSTP